MVPRFRAWHKELKHMYAVLRIDFEEKTAYLGHALTGELYDNDLFEYHPFDEIELMQCTGYKDKNGIYIYTNDLCLLTCDGEPEWKELMQIYFHKELCHWGVTRYWGDEEARWSDDFTDCIVDGCYFEVIGNVYENKDLLNA